MDIIPKFHLIKLVIPIWKKIYDLDEPAERVVVPVPKKPAGIGYLAYLLVTKLVHSEIPFIAVGIVGHVCRKDATPLELLQMLVVKLKQMCSYHPTFALNDVVDNAFYGGRHEISKSDCPTIFVNKVSPRA